MSEIPETIADAIEENAKGPAKASGDTGTVEQHSIPDQIAADNHIAAKTAATRKHCGIRFFKINSPGGLV